MSTTTLNATITDVNQNFFRDPINPARRGRTEAEANRRWRQVLENQLIGEQGLTDEQATARVRAQRPWLY